MSSSASLDALVDALTCLPGVGRKSAQRMALYLLDRNREGAAEIVRSMETALTTVRHCASCRNYSDTERCAICEDSRRDQTMLCIVETPADVLAIEAAGSYNGLYFVLLGRLSPIDGIGPHELGLDLLQQRLDEESISEIILATNPTVEGEITARYIADLAQQHQTHISRIAHGVPLGGELEYVDSGTLTRALSGRQRYS
jgi:recombination protein RecR